MVQGQEQQKDSHFVLAIALEKAELDLTNDYTLIIGQIEHIIRRLSEGDDFGAGRLSTVKAEDNSTILVSNILQEALGKRNDEVVDILKKTFSNP